MSWKGGTPRGPWGLNVTLLKWSAIVLPILFLVFLDVVRQTVFAGQAYILPGLSGLVFTYVFITVVVVLFSFGVFGLIERMQRRVLEQNRQLASLNEIAAAAGAQPQLQDLLDTALERVVLNLGVGAGLICLVDMERGEHSATSSRGLSPQMVQRLQRAMLQADPVASEVVRTGRPVIYERVFENPAVREAARREGIRSGISVPLKYEGEVRGILAIAARRERQFTDTEQQFLESIAGQLGMAIGNASLYEQSQLRNRELGALLAVGKVVTSSLDLESLLEAALDTLIQVTSADAAEAWLVEGEGLVMRCHRGAHREAFLEQTRFRLGQGIPGLVAQLRTPMLVHDLPTSGIFLRSEVIKAGYHTFCAVPLLRQDKVVGVLAVAALSPEALTSPWEVQLLDSMAEWLALGLENAHLYQQVQDMAVLQERERIAHEMHDGIAQLLGYVNAHTLAVRKLLADGRVAEGREELAKMGEVARDLYADVREGILSLRTAARPSGGLLPSLQEYAERYTDLSGVQVHLQGAAALGSTSLSPATEIQLMRILQEAMSNVRKHAMATRVEITCQQADGHLHVTIADDGHGFDLARLPATGWPRFGLQTMQERAAAVGGSLRIDSAPGRGTRVEVLVPLAPGQEAEP